MIKTVARLALLLAAAAPGAAFAQAPATPAMPTMPATPAMPAMPATPGMPATPQDQEAMMKTMRLAAYNQLGVLEYCQGRGSADASAVDVQKRLITMLPPGPSDGQDAAEAAGKAGKVVFNGNELAIEDAAKRQNTTPEAMCRQMETMLKNTAAQLPQAPKP